MSASTAVDKAALVGAPITAADGVGLRGVARIANTGASQSVAVPVRYFDKYINLRPVGASVQIGFSFATAAPTVVSNQASAWGTGHVSAGATIADGELYACLVPSGATFLAWISSAAAGFLEIYCSESLAVSK